MSKFFKGLKDEIAVEEFIDRVIYKDDKILSSVYLVKMSYYYDCEVDKPIHIENEVILMNDGCTCWEWLNDWYEGQQNVIVYAIYGIDELDLQNNI